MAPIIGVTATLKEDVETAATRPLGRFVRTDLDYVEGVAQAGGVPLILPPVVRGKEIETIVDSLDGLLLSGGSDLHPDYYGEEPLPELGPTIPERDEFEMGLVEVALLRGIPIFGICRGMQVLNVAFGGTLYQDLPSQMAVDLTNHSQETPKSQPTHEVEFYPHTYTAEVAGSSVIKVNSYHHQAIKELAGDLVVTARSSDDIIEAVEYRDLSERWILGVQWHAEAMRDAGREHRRFFEAHVAAAKRHALDQAA
ncbi:MAG: gamma-glutamyl-gamma-aminobutyrate hydrolase family protein [Rubrobacteraceae bacterium]